MERMIGVCGLVCTECPAFLAYQTDDDDLRVRTASEWSEMYNADLTPEDINCTGCMSKEGVQIAHCNVCEIRKCGLEKNVLNCALCDDYICDKLSEFFNYAPEAKDTLDGIRGGF